MAESTLARSQCPTCRTTVRIDNLSYKLNAQRTECANGHKVWRIWNGPEDDMWRPNDPERPYGWSHWELHPTLPLVKSV